MTRQYPSGQPNTFRPQGSTQARHGHGIPKWVILTLVGIGIFLFAGVTTIVVLAARAIRGPEIAVAVPDDFVQHAGASGVGIKAPADWVETPASTSTSHIEINLTSPDALRAATNMIATAIEPGETLATVVSSTPDYLATRFKNFTLIRARRVQIGGEPSAELVYENDASNGVRVRVDQFFWLKDGQQYILTMAIQPQAYDAFHERFLQVASSVQLSGATESLAAQRAARTAPVPNPVRPTPMPSGPARPVVPPGFPMPVGAMPNAPPEFPLPPRADAPPSPAERAAQLKQVESTWQNPGSAAQSLLATMQGPASHADDGTATLVRGQRITTSERFTPPVTFRIELLADNNDIRLGYAFSQMIFNWEMRPTELRVDGGPISGKYKPGAGALAANRWTGIELTVTRSECVVRVDGVERYRMAGDFSKVDAPLSIESHVGQTQVAAVSVVK